MIKKSIDKILQGSDLSFDNMKEIMNEIMTGNATPAQIGSFLTALRIKGETIEEITACASVMKETCQNLEHDFDLFDIVGTGGDKLNTFNISTLSSIVVASSGVKTAKHGNRYVSGKCGSADVLENLGVNINLSFGECKNLVEDIGLCFLYSPMFYISMRHVATVRKDLGFRTIFNILGPLVNPANASTRLVGVYSRDLVEPIAQSLLNLGVKKAYVVHGHDGLDEISLTAPTTICEAKDDKLEIFNINPEDFGFRLCKIQDLVGGNPIQNAEIALRILKGEPGPKRDVVILNSAFSLKLCHEDLSFKDCIKLSTELIDSGKALEKLNNLVEASNYFLKMGVRNVSR